MAQIFSGDLQFYVLLGVRILVAIGAGIVGWYLTPPLVMVLHRVFARKPASPYLLGGSRLAGTMLLAVLAFFLIDIGLGGGLGIGSSGDGGKIGKYTQKKKKEDPQAKPPQKKRPNTPIAIHMIESEKYQKDRRFYLVDGKEPAKTLEEVSALLRDNLNKWGRLDIVVHDASVAPSSDAVKLLKKIGKENDLITAVVER